MNTDGLSINLATVRQQWNLREAVEACVRHGIRAVDPWRDQVAAIGLDQSVRVIKANGMRVTGYCRGGMFPAADDAGRLAAIDDNKRAIDEAAALGRRMSGARRRWAARRAPAISALPGRW